jgi:hypothetical protein
VTAIHEAFQWLLDPDGDPNTADAPAVVNGSWAYGVPGCNLEFQPDVQALVAAGILPVFAGGNYGSGAETSVSPANYPESLAVGSVSNTGLIQSTSSRGPSTCGEASTIYPEMVAPGLGITTADLFGLTQRQSGTSLAAPHVSGAAALLLSAHPEVAADQLRAALTSTAVDLGAAGPDNTYGYGMLDIPAADAWLSAGGGTTTTTVATTTTTPPSTSTTTTVATTTTTVSPRPADLVFEDGFESGDLAGWSYASTNGGNLMVTTGATLEGGYGLAATIANRTDMYVADTSPLAESSYHARFLYDPNGVVSPGTRRHRIFHALDADGSAVVFLEVRAASGGYEVRPGARHNGTRTKYGAWTLLTDAAHTLELGWTASSSSSARDGALTLWIDGTTSGTITKLQTGASTIDEARLGPQSIDRSVAGTEYFDGFVSTESSYVGP